jgi:hypothetical protein
MLVRGPFWTDETMERKRRKSEVIVAKMLQVDVLTGQGR